MMLKGVLGQEAQERLWNLQEAQLSHTPMTEQGASSISSAFRDIRRQLQKQYRFAVGEITSDEFLGVDKDFEDGVMRFVED